MKYVEPSCQEILIDDPVDKIATVARNCYLSVPRSSDETPFVTRLLNNRHLAMFEHKLLTFALSNEHYHSLRELNNPFIELTSDESGPLATLSVRTLIENSEKEPIKVLIGALPVSTQSIFFPGQEFKAGLAVRVIDFSELTRLSEQEKNSHLFVTMKIITDRGVSHELVRHRRCSFAQESTRYCNYSKDKFKGELTFIRPSDYTANGAVYDRVFQNIEDAYLELTARKVTPDFARAILPNSLKTSIVVTANLDEWKLIFDLRTSSAAHPDMNKVMALVKRAFAESGYVRGEDKR